MSSIPSRRPRQGQSNSVPVVKIRRKTIDAINILVELGYYSSGSEFVREAIFFPIRKVIAEHEDVLDPKNL